MTTRTSPARQAARASRRPEAGAVGAGEPVVDVDALGFDAEPGEGAALGSEVLGVGGAVRVADLESGHRCSVSVVPPSPVLFTEPVLRDSASCGFSVWCADLRECRRGFALWEWLANRLTYAAFD